MFFDTNLVISSTCPCVSSPSIPLFNHIKFDTFKYLFKTFSNLNFETPGFLSCMLLRRHSLVKIIEAWPLTSIAPPYNTILFNLFLILTLVSMFFISFII